MATEVISSNLEDHLIFINEDDHAHQGSDVTTGVTTKKRNWLAWWWRNSKKVKVCHHKQQHDDGEKNKKIFTTEGFKLGKLLGLKWQPWIRRSFFSDFWFKARKTYF